MAKSIPSKFGPCFLPLCTSPTLPNSAVAPHGLPLVFFPQKCESFLSPEFRSFAVDPQITSLDVLQHILIRAFDLNG